MTSDPLERVWVGPFGEDYVRRNTGQSDIDSAVRDSGAANQSSYVEALTPQVLAGPIVELARHRERRTERSRRGRALVSGRGAERVVGAVHSLGSAA